MLKKIGIFSLLLLPFTVSAQQIAHAKDVQLVSTPGIKLVLQGGIKFTGTTTWKDSGTTTLLTNPAANIADWVDSTSGVLINNEGTTVFNNTITQQEIIGPTAFYNLTLRDKATNLHQSNEVKNILALDTGLVYFQTATDSIYVSNAAIAAITSTSSYNKSWVHGKLSRKANVTGSEYLFPIGKINGIDSLYAPVKIDKAITTDAIYTAVYFPTLPFDNLNILNPPIDHISYVENWEVYCDAAPVDANARLSLSWRGYSQVSANAAVRDSLLIAQYIFNPAGRWEATGGGYQAIVTGADSLSGYVKHRSLGVNYTYAERRYTLASWSKWNALPVKLLYWTATADGNKVRLNWNVEQEQDVVKYEVEKSLNGLNFSHLLTVNSLQKAQWLYTNYDLTPAIGWNYYRLKITDKANKVTYAGIRKVRFDKGLQTVGIFPNPTTDYLNIQLPTNNLNNIQLQLYTIEGRLLNELKPVSSSVRLNVQNLAGGTYLLKVIQNDDIKTYPFVKQ